MTTLREAAQQALEALEAMNPYPASKEDQRASALAALRAALAQQAEPVQEPITRLFGTLPVHDAQQAEPAQEPVAWRYKPMIGSSWSLSDDGYYISCKRDKGYIVDSLYTAPPQRKPLTDEEAAKACGASGNLGPLMQIVRAVERAHGIEEKNRGR